MKFAVNVDDEGKREFLNKAREDPDGIIKEMSRLSFREQTSMKYLLENIYAEFSFLKTEKYPYIII